MSEWFGRIKASARHPSAAAVLADLVEFHSARPGITEATLGACRTHDGRTGYDVLVSHVPNPARAVLDLGAGNGPLLARLLERAPSLERVVAVDACASDLELARQRVAGDPRALFLAEPAEQLSLQDQSIDVVLSHHAFYLMRPIEAVVRQIARVLVPGGVFAFVTWSARASTLEPFAELMRAFGPLTARDNPHFEGWGDPRAFSAPGLRELLVVPALFLDPLVWDEHDLELVEPADALCARLMGFFYSVELQRPETRELLRRRWTEILERTRDTDGLAHLAFPFACGRATRVSADGAV